MSLPAVLYFFSLPFPSPLYRILKVTSRHLLSQGPDFSVQFSRSDLSDSLHRDCIMPDFPVHHQLPESTQIHVH